jgi:selenoprotein W-related protein
MYKLQLESILLIPASGGEFEVSVNDELIYSKLEKGVFPQPGEITGAIDERM